MSNNEALGKLEKVEFEVLNPRGKIDTVTVSSPQPRITDLDDKIIGLYSNSKPGMDNFFTVFEELLKKKYPDVKLDELYVDNAAQQLIKRPHEFDVIVTTNMFGDILSDEAAILVGSLGMASGGNIGMDYAIFEPIHGSAPKYAGKEIANPSSMILAASMMFEWLGNKYVDNKLKKVSETIEQALIDTFKEGICTRDIGGEAKTGEVGRAVADNIWKFSV